MSRIFAAIPLMIVFSCVLHAQRTPDGTISRDISIGGKRVYCTSGGGPVLWIASYGLNDVGSTAVGNRTTITYNPQVLDQMSDALKLFWLGHECGHAYLRTSDESRADCWSATTGVKQGWFDMSDADQLEADIQDNPGDNSHPTGPVRAAHVKKCMKAASPHDESFADTEDEHHGHADTDEPAPVPAPVSADLDLPDAGPTYPPPSQYELGSPDQSFIEELRSMLAVDADDRLLRTLDFQGTPYYPSELFFGHNLHLCSYYPDMKRIARPSCILVRTKSKPYADSAYARLVRDLRSGFSSTHTITEENKPHTFQDMTTFSLLEMTRSSQVATVQYYYEGADGTFVIQLQIRKSTHP